MVRAPGRPPFGVVVALALVASGCGSSGLTPVTYPDSSVPCPAGLHDWKLEVLDRRARREGSEGIQALVGQSIRQSFPGCQWDSAAGEGAGRVQIEIHRFAASQDGNTWEAAADWSVLASDPSGRTLTEFEANEEVSRPNYRGSNNEKEALREAFDRAMRRTLAGLRAVTSVAVFRLPGRTVSQRASVGRPEWGAVSHSPRGTSGPGSRRVAAKGLERFSHPSGPEVL
jgi:hypothetical protein